MWRLATPQVLSLIVAARDALSARTQAPILTYGCGWLPLRHIDISWHETDRVVAKKRAASFPFSSGPTHRKIYKLPR